jgi:hypothetical protein
MSPSRSWLQRAHRALASHVDRLQDTLAVLTVRVRETVAQAVSSNLAGAIREAVHALFTDDTPSNPPPSYPRPPYRFPPPWGEPERYDRAEEDDLPPPDWSHDQPRAWREVECSPPEPTRPQGHDEQRRACLHHALAIGCQAAAWWLRRQVNRASAFAAFGIGLLASGAAFIAGIGLADAALHLMNLADAVRSGTHALSVLP